MLGFCPIAVPDLSAEWKPKTKNDKQWCSPRQPHNLVLLEVIRVPTGILSIVETIRFNALAGVEMVPRCDHLSSGNG